MNDATLSLSNHTLAVDSHERPKNFLTPGEITRLLKGAKKSRYPVRDQAIILMLYHHGLRETELCRLCVTDIDLKSAQLWVKRLKNGLSTQHPVSGEELRLIKRYLSSKPDTLSMPWLFITERGGQLGRHTVIYIVSKAAERAGLGKVTPHMLRHSCGYYLANKGYDNRLIQDYLGHRDPKHTARYTRTAGSRFERMWD